MKLKRATKHLFSTLLYFLGMIVVMFLLYFVITMPHAEAVKSKVKGEYILFVTFDNGLVEETLFGGSYLTPTACIEAAKLDYPIDGKPWIGYTCIHEDIHEYLEKMKNKGQPL